MGRDRGTAAARGTRGETAPPGTQGSSRVEGTIYGRAFKLLALACAALVSGIADSGSVGEQRDNIAWADLSDDSPLFSEEELMDEV